MKHLFLIALMACSAIAMKVSAQTDATNYIVNPSFENNGLSGWTVSGLSTQSNTSFSPKSGTIYAEKWVAKGSYVGNASARQTVKNLPFGKYRLTVAAQNLNQNSTTAQCAGAYIFAGAEQTPVYTPGDYTVDFSCKSGEVEIGFVAENAKGNWLAIDNFRLTLLETIPTETVLEELNQRIVVAEELLPQDMDAKVNKMLDEAITAAKAITVASETKVIVSVFSALNAAIDKADFAVKLANATPGTGTAVKVTLTNKYVPTGASEALMRFNSTGSNIKERGVCWSTEHNPTVLDSRTTEYWTLNGNIYHVTGLNSATVYYLRPYVMNDTYTVAYGEEVKIVTHPRGTCSWSWDNGAPDEAANTRCRNAIKETIDYFNEWTGIAGFTLSGHYGAQTQTADCSYGGWMRIGPNQANQAIGTVIHETGHGVGVGTRKIAYGYSAGCYDDTNLHNWKWFGREANKVYSFLENKEADPYNSDFCMVGDGTHAWGSNATYDWFVNGADKDKHIPLQYAGGCILLYGMFVDGLCPTDAYKNGLPAYTFNFDENKKYYIMCKDADSGLNIGLMTARTTRLLRWKNTLTPGVELTDNDAWNIEFDPKTGYYNFKNVGVGKYLTHLSGTTSTAVSMSDVTAAMPLNSTHNFQLMPDRTDVTIGEKGDFKTHGYWFTWTDGVNKSMSAGALSSGWGLMEISNFDFSDAATKQQFIIISEDELRQYYPSYAPKSLTGDVDGNGVVNIDDVTVIINVICGGGANSKADVDGNNIVNIDDVTAVINIICGN